MPAMRKVHTAESIIEIAHLRNVLESSGIDCEVRNDSSRQRAGGDPFLEAGRSCGCAARATCCAPRPDRRGAAAPPRRRILQCRPAASASRRSSPMLALRAEPSRPLTTLTIAARYKDRRLRQRRLCVRAGRHDCARGRRVRLLAPPRSTRPLELAATGAGEWLLSSQAGRSLARPGTPRLDVPSRRATAAYGTSQHYRAFASTRFRVLRLWSHRAAATGCASFPACSTAASSRHVAAADALDAATAGSRSSSTGPRSIAPGISRCRAAAGSWCSANCRPMWTAACTSATVHRHRWRLGAEGRKHYAGTALSTRTGAGARARATWIELKRGGND